MSGAPKYEAVIGLEIHVQLRTKSKMFCRCDNRADGAKPNELTCPVCLGLPGALPVPNRTAVEWALKASAALGCTIAEESKFDRKQYFYPDLPKGYQISQYDQPLGGPGTFEFDMVEDGKPVTKKIGITRLHLEEDAGKLTHPKGADYSLVDLNRSGTPLAEIVTEPDLRSPAEAKAFMQELRLLMRMIGVSDADMEKGHLRADANVSLRKPGEKKLGTKTELKNLNSFRFVERGLAAEIERQTALLEQGKKVDQETRGFDVERGRTVSQRGKEEAHDYRYFPEPDIPPLRPHELGIDKLRAELPELPVIRKRRWRDLGVAEEAIVMAVSDQETSTAFDRIITKVKHPREISNRWRGLYSSDVFPEDDPEKLEHTLIVLDKEGLTSDIKVAAVITAMDHENISVEQAIEKLVAMSEEEIESIVDQAIKDNPKPAADFKAGNANAKQVIVGAVMKATKGAVDAREVAQLLEKKLS